MKAAPCPVPSETRKLNRLMTALHVKLMPKVDMVEARGGVDVETEDVVGYGHPMVRVHATFIRVTLHFYITQHFVTHVRRKCLAPNAFAHTRSTPPPLRSLAPLCSLPQPIRPKRVCSCSLPLPLRPTRVRRATLLPLTRSARRRSSRTTTGPKTSRRRRRRPRLYGWQGRSLATCTTRLRPPGPPARRRPWRRRRRRRRRSRRWRKPRRARAANKVSLLEEGAHAHVHTG